MNIPALCIFTIGAVSYLAFGWLTEPILKDEDLAVFSGKVTETWQKRSKSPVMEVILSGQPIPFRCSSDVFPGGFLPDSLEALKVGVDVSVGVERSKIDSPRRNWLFNQKHYEVITMKIAGRDALPIAEHNLSVESNRRFGPWLCLIMGLLSLSMLILFLRHGQKRPKTSKKSGSTRHK